jgi:MFS family permease
MIYAFLVGMAGNAFSVGIAWNSAWFPRDRQGFALGVFGAGNVGASVTKLVGPALITLVPLAGLLGGLVPGGWRFVPFLYGISCLLMAAAIWFICPHHDFMPGALPLRICCGRCARCGLAQLQPLLRGGVQITAWRCPSGCRNTTWTSSAVAAAAALAGPRVSSSRRQPSRARGLDRMLAPRRNHTVSGP